MIVKLFLLGSPGSGKSTVARYIESLVRDEHGFLQRINDYTILQEMFEEDQQKGEGRFKPAYHGGFDVLEFEAFDEALRELEQRSSQQISEGPEQKIVLLEFARNDYRKAFQQFSLAFLQDAYFLYFDTNIEVCKQRISARVANPQTEDDYYVSDYIFQTYYNHDNGQYLTDILAKEYNIEQQRVKIVTNNGELEAAEKNIEVFIQSVMADTA